jgi:hypothetical protein
MMRRLTAMLSAAFMATAACGDNKPAPLRQNSNEYSYVITPDDIPPHARQDIHYSIQIFDRKSREPIQNGEGQIFASNAEHAKTWDGLTYGPEAGTYHAKMNFVVAGTWAVAIRFRRDSIRPLERIDWMQEVMDEKPGSIP